MNPQVARQIGQLKEAISAAYEFAWFNLDAEMDIVSQFSRPEVTPKDYMDFPFEYPLDPADEIREGESPAFEIPVQENVKIYMADYGKGFFFMEKDINNPLERDKLLRWATRVPSILRYQKKVKMLEILRDGETEPITYDGVPLFSESHLVGKNGLTWSNKINYTGEATGEKLTQWLARFKRIPWVLGADGNPRLHLPIMSLNPTFTMFVAPERQYLWDEILHNSMKPEKYYNTENALLRLVTIAELETDADLFPDPDFVDDIYIIMTLQGTPPFILLQREGMEGEDLRISNEKGGEGDRQWGQMYWARNEFGIGVNQFIYFLKVSKITGSGSGS